MAAAQHCLTSHLSAGTKAIAAGPAEQGTAEGDGGDKDTTEEPVSLPSTAPLHSGDGKEEAPLGPPSRAEAR